MILSITDGTPLYKKYFNKKLDNADVFGVQQVTGILDCEKLCEKHMDCVGVNIIYCKKCYPCEFLASIPDFKPDELSESLLGKFIRVPSEN